MILCRLRGRIDLIRVHFLTCSEQIVAQQFEFGKRIMEKGLIPILEPEININSPDKGECEAMLLDEIIENVSIEHITVPLLRLSHFLDIARSQ